MSDLILELEEEQPLVVTIAEDSALEVSVAEQIVIGGAANLQSKSVSYTPTESAQSAQVTADAGYDGLSEVDISVGAISDTYVGSGVPRRTAYDLVVSNDKITTPAGYYEAAVSQRVATGTAGTPTASKGAVSNHAIAVTPSVTNTSGYITGGTKTGTAVSVAASELVSGTKSITSNGTGIDVTNYAAVDVAVPSGTPTLQNKTIHPSSSDQSITADNGYDGLGTVTAKAVTTTNLTAANIVSGVTVEVGDADDSDRVASVTGTASGGDPNENLTALLGGSLETINCGVVNLKQNVSRSSYVKHIFLPNCTTFSAMDLFYQNTELIDVVLPSLTTLGTTSRHFYNCTKLEYADFGGGNIPANMFNGCTNFGTLILRNSSIFPLGNVNAFTNTKFKSGGAGGDIYIPKTLYDALGTGTNDYKAASNWSTVDGYGTITWHAIEGSYYETHYGDGSTIPT